MIEGFPYADYPTGWFQVAWSAQLDDGAVLPLEYFGRQLVMYRRESGAPAVLDAYCPHLGAHLGYGGTVSGEDVRCPFHGWCWGPDGRNTDIPYGGRSHLNIGIRAYPTVEVDGLILMWFDEDGAEPTWEVPEILPVDQPFFDLFPDCAGGDRLRIQPQLMVENTVDAPHLYWAHRWQAGEPELVTADPEGHRFVARMRGKLASPKGVVEMDVTEYMYGLGLIVAPMTGIRPSVNVAGTTPIDHDYSYVFVSTFVSCPEGADPSAPDNIAKAMARAQRREIIGEGGVSTGDRDIWEHQRYVVRPPLVSEEAAGMRAIRAWASQFYKAAANGSSHTQAEGSSVSSGRLDR